ncbi:MAG: hypothetical protein FVQ81_13370 [Candidatus Glassbacteria bacterium]|nr:hypothetical protein [Candidatus Glassbacteria bacterium]
MTMDTTEMWTFGALVLLLFAGWIWLRRHQHKNRLERERKLRCKELILDHRLPLVRRKVDFNLLVDLVREGIGIPQLEKVIELLTAGPVEYHIDEDDEGEGLEMILGLEDKPAEAGEKTGPEKKKPEEQPVNQEDESVEEVEVEEGMPPEKEKAWFRMAHNRYRHALADKEITERQAKFRMLVKMVELGKKAVKDDSTKPVKRKEYEITLWDKFYENEYLELNQE